MSGQHFALSRHARRYFVLKPGVRLSRDEGKTWPHAKVLHAGPAAYSCLAVLPDGTIGCLYERGDQGAYETLTFARFSLDWLTGDAGPRAR